MPGQVKTPCPCGCGGGLTEAQIKSLYGQLMVRRRRTNAGGRPRKDPKEAIGAARAWTETDKLGSIRDIYRLGLAGAALYARDLAEQAISRGDDRFRGITVQALRDALKAVKAEYAGGCECPACRAARETAVLGGRFS